jgi:hypothetical protein
MKIPYQDKMIDATEVEPVASKEEWNEYQMANGDILLIKAVLVRALKADNDLKAPDGMPLYSVNTQIIVKVKSVS